MKPICNLLAAAMMAAFAYPVHAAPLLSGFSHGILEPPAATGSSQTDRAPVVLAQSGDPTYRIGQLEEQVRGLTGRIEELGFQLLQMQEQMRQMQQDNEFRFQELEKTGNQRGDAGSSVPSSGVEPSSTASTSTQQGAGAPATDLGSIKFDKNGDLIGGIIEPMDQGSQTAALSSPEDLYQTGYNHMLAGDYSLAEQVFQDYVTSFPESARASDAMFWLGEAQYSQARYQESAKTFLDAHKQYPQADKGADSLLKLGMSLARLDNRETACATLREVLIRYPGASAAVRAKVSEEQKLASC
ncbi:tol-pal system protein YbgF [Hoeflea sp. YIM 152468]|uniref:tol-pal system protein YbgF n=1 Tax=Hoeflea sp. YIM 152468 TaxID=3031759 RepID=UPI0023D9DF97|nr:tol-pal system protein YbgF [Hoeflea sp. YIM 152468]MDF1607958.1 tol-pal system protein YbgF [Hoeflea sp. YIM 152468]